jgi:hypothetical protein
MDGGHIETRSHTASRPGPGNRSIGGTARRTCRTSRGNLQLWQFWRFLFLAIVFSALSQVGLVPLFHVPQSCIFRLGPFSGCGDDLFMSSRFVFGSTSWASLMVASPQCSDQMQDWGTCVLSSICRPVRLSSCALQNRGCRRLSIGSWKLIGRRRGSSGTPRAAFTIGSVASVRRRRSRRRRCGSTCGTGSAPRV